MAAGNPNLWSIHESMQPSSSSTSGLLAFPSPLMLSPHDQHHYVPAAAGSSPLPFTLAHTPPPHSWSQLLLGDEDRAPAGGLSQYNQQPKKLEIWDHEEEASSNLNLWPRGVAVPLNLVNVDIIKQESENSQHSRSYSHGDSKDYCVTTSTCNMLDFSKSMAADGRDQSIDHQQSECNSSASSKKPRISSAQPPLKVRKEKLGDRITALHQLVSPFGKTDTASVLLEAIGYIRFLQGQIEALSSPYLGNARTGRSVQVEGSCIFAEELAGQDGHGFPKDLRSRGLCLVPVACTHHVGSEINGAEFWAPALGGGF